MDRIIVIDKGKIIEQGSHNELLANENSLYKELWTLQAGGFLKDDHSTSSGQEDESVSIVAMEDSEDEEGDGEKGEAKMVNF